MKSGPRTSVWVASAAVLASSSAACLVVDRFEYGEPNVPPHVSLVAPLSFTRVPPEPDAECNTESGERMRFTVAISDANIEDPLQVNLVINGALATTRVVSTTGVADRGELTLCAPADNLRERCNHVILAVTRQFVYGDPLVPAEAGDLSTVEWWVLGPSSTAADAEPEDCALLLAQDGGVP